jgi:hypothetical protein
MKIKKNGKVIKLTESDLQKIVKRVVIEQETKPEEEAKPGKKSAYVKHFEEDRKGKQLGFILPGSEYKGKKFVEGPYVLIGEKGSYQRIKRKDDRGDNQKLREFIGLFSPDKTHTNAEGALNNFVKAIESAGFNVSEVLPGLEAIRSNYFSRKGNSDYTANYGQIGPEETLETEDGFELRFKPVVYYDGATKEPKFKKIRRVNVTTNRGDEFIILPKSNGGYVPDKYTLRGARYKKGTRDVTPVDIGIGSESLQKIMDTLRTYS